MPTVITALHAAWCARVIGIQPAKATKVRKPEELPVIGDTQKKRAAKKLKALSAEDRKKVEALVKDVKSTKEKDYLYKALATNHSIAEVEAFAKKIRGKDEAWLKDNLSLTGSTSGKGVKQQWSHSCNATTVQAVKGQLDPLYALKVREENTNITGADDSDATALNAKLAAEQKKMLESEYDGTKFGKHTGVAANRDDGDSGGGRWADDLLNDMTAVTGVAYKNKEIDDKKYTVAAAMRDVERGAKKGMPVPIVIGGAVGDYAHYVLVTGYLKGPPAAWVIHDPWDGVTVNRTVADVKAGKINLAGHKRLTALENPKAK